MARARTAREDYRPRGDRWRDDDDAAQAWAEGMTGIPIVDLGMRQLRAEGWMHNRARLITGSFLTKSLYLDWRIGEAAMARRGYPAPIVDLDQASTRFQHERQLSLGL